MKEIAKTHKDQLKRIKKNVENSYDTSKENYESFNFFRNFVFVTSMDSQAASVNEELQKNVLEFNVLETNISRLLGEFIKNELGVVISSSDDYHADDENEKTQQAELIRVLEGHCRYLIQEANKEGFEYNIYRDTLSGGMSGIKVYTKYSGEKSFHQDIVLERVYDPTLVGFDVLAMKPDKSDGMYCFQNIPMRKEDFIEEFGIDVTGMKFTRKLDAQMITSMKGSPTFGPFQWAYSNNRDDIIVVCDYYEKVKKKETIIQLAATDKKYNNKTVTEKEYREILDEWAKMEENGEITLPPIEINRRKTEVTKIVRYQLIEKQVIHYEETDFKDLPLIFIDGNSIMTRNSDTGSSVQKTRPYIWHAIGAQKMKNFAGQSLCNEIENMRPPTVIASIESVDEKYLEGYNNPQNTSVLLYNAFLNGDYNAPLAPPMICPRPPIPAEISQAFIGADAIIQNILGSIDSSMSQLTEAQMSGKAIVEVMTANNATAMPFLKNYMLGFQSAMQMAVNMMALYYKTPRTIPIITKDGKRDYVQINQNGEQTFNYEHDSFKVKIQAGPSFGVQQTRALQQITALMNTSPMFAQFINEAGLDIVLDNVEIRNVETLRERSEKWMKQQEQAKQAAMQTQAQQPKLEQQALQIAAQQVQSENQVGMAKVQVQAMDSQSKSALKAAEIELDKQKLTIELAQIIAELKIEEEKLGIEQQEADDRRVTTVIDSAIKQAEHTHGLADKHYDRALRALESDRNHEMTKTAADEAMESIVTGE